MVGIATFPVMQLALAVLEQLLQQPKSASKHKGARAMSANKKETKFCICHYYMSMLLCHPGKKSICGHCSEAAELEDKVAGFICEFHLRSLLVTSEAICGKVNELMR